MVSAEDKRRICARLFFQDNQDQYEDYHEAAAEFLSGNNASDKFVDFTVEAIVRPEPGHMIFVRDDGHVASLRMEDGFFEPRTEMTEDEGEENMEKFGQAFEDDPELEPLGALKAIGWRAVDGEQSGG